MGVVTGWRERDSFWRFFEWIKFAATFASTHTTTVYNFSFDVFLRKKEILYTVHRHFYVRVWESPSYSKSVAKTVYLVAMFFKSMLRMIVQCLNCCTAGARLVDGRKVWENTHED
jgi:hypothetical protein